MIYPTFFASGGTGSIPVTSTRTIVIHAQNRRIFGGIQVVGEAAMIAKKAVSDLDVRRTWILFGDPAMKLF